MKYFDETNEILKPYEDYGRYVIYSIDKKNRKAGLELNFDECQTIDEASALINDALATAFEKYELSKVYVNVIRDNYLMYNILSRFNFVTEAIHRGEYYDVSSHDVVYMTVMKHEWQLGGIRYNYKYDTYDVDIL